MSLETRVRSLTVAPQGEPVFSEQATTISIEDDAGGEFVVICQNTDEYTKVAISPSEWPSIRAAVDQLVKDCRP